MGMLVLLPLLLVGCANKQIRIYPITDQDIKKLEKSQSFEAPKDGWFLSDFYMDQIVDAKVN